MKRIHFLSDVRDMDHSYECRRCGHVTSTKIEMYEHRRGLPSECYRNRVRQRIADLVRRFT